MNNVSLTPALVVLLVGLTAFAYYDRDSLCKSGTPSMSASVQNYINTKISKSAAKPDKSEMGKSVKDVTERLITLDRNSFGTMQLVNGLELMKRNMPEEAFDFEDIPLLENEKNERRLEIMDYVIARVRRACREGVK